MEKYNSIGPLIKILLLERQDLYSRIDIINENIDEIQENCDHQFIPITGGKKCVICTKIINYEGDFF